MGDICIFTSQLAPLVTRKLEEEPWLSFHLAILSRRRWNSQASFAFKETTRNRVLNRIDIVKCTKVFCANSV